MAKNNRVRVRFHLGAGEHFKHWKITYPNGDYQFVNPEKQNMIFHDCKLRVQKKTAEKIYAGGEKVVCAWIECDWVQMLDLTSTGEPLSFNPRVTPHWVYGSQIADNFVFSRIQTVGSKLIVI